LHPSTSIHDSAAPLNENGHAPEAEKENTPELANTTAESATPGFASSTSEHDMEGDSASFDGIHSDSEDEPDDDDEPALKYEKLGGAAQELLAKDTASALNVSLRLMVSAIQHFHPRVSQN
jgi:hypothetical protein